MRQPSSRRKPSAIERSSARRKGWLRLTRTIVLGTIAAVFAIIWMGDQYGIEREVMYEFLATSALFVGLLVVAGLAGAALIMAVRWLFHRRD
ncbi:MAG: hypothetical protein NXH95_19790 [Pseudomonadaceae bacterium]|nr:hypothetical protein [Pseudomonadaceae bacterium]